MARKQLACWSSKTSFTFLVVLGLLLVTGCGESNPVVEDAGTDTAVEMDSSVECDEGKWGASCENTCDCVNGTCNDGRAGTGVCTCTTGFAGASCNTCITGFYGPTCTGACDCQYGTCDEGIAGSGACMCSPNYDGDMCEDCVEGRYGATCTDECVDCNAGTCTDGITGDGACVCSQYATTTTEPCDTCMAGRYGPQCESECTCLNGTCSEGIAGDGTCACTAGWIGPTCSDRPRSCAEVLANNPTAPDGPYTIKPDSGAALEVYCDMTTFGGGWMLVLNYVHQGNTNPALSVRGTAGQLATPPLLNPASVLGDDESLPTPATSTYWGHTSRALLSRFTFTELRFYGRSNGTAAAGSIMHFVTAAPGCNTYFRSGSGSCSDIAHTWTKMSDHTAHLLFDPPGAPLIRATTANMVYTTGRNDEAMTFEPFHVSNGIGWGMRVGGNRWEVDDWCGDYGCSALNNDDRSTIHRLWVR